MISDCSLQRIETDGLATGADDSIHDMSAMNDTDFLTGVMAEFLSSECSKFKDSCDRFHVWRQTKLAT